jgi:hypothetical protein
MWIAEDDQDPKNEESNTKKRNKAGKERNVKGRQSRNK